MRQKTIDQKDDLIVKVKNLKKTIDEQATEIENLKDREFGTDEEKIKELKSKLESQNIDLSNIIAEKEEEIDAKTLNVANLKKDVDKLRKENKSLKKKMETKEKNLDEALESRYKLLQDLEEMTEQKRIQEEEKEATQIALEGREKSFKKAQNDLEAKLVELGIKKSDFETESLNLLSETTQTVNNLNESQDMFEETQQQAQPLIDQISDSESGSDSEDSGNNSKIEMTEIDDGEEEFTTVVEDSDDENIDNKKENADNEDDNIINKEGNVINKEDETNSVINKQSKENEEENEDKIEEEDEGKNYDEKELFLASDEEYENENFDVGIYTVKNYSKPDISIVKDVNVPSSIKNKLFQPSSVSIKQKVVFVAVGTG